MIAFLFGVLVVQLFNLQLVQYDDNLSSAESKKTKIITSQGSRGTIMDVNSLTMAYEPEQTEEIPETVNDDDVLIAEPAQPADDFESTLLFSLD